MPITIKIIKRFFFVSCLTLAALVSVNNSKAQAYRPQSSGLTQNWRVNLNTGSSIFYGDLKDQGILPYDIDMRFGYGLMVRKQFTPVFTIGGQLYNSKLKSTDKYLEEGVEKAVTFEADVFEYNLHFLFDFVPLLNGYAPDRKMSAYMFLGLGLSNWKTIVKDYNTNETLRAHGFTGKGPGKRTSELVVPLGLGLRYNINNSLGITFETSLHTVNSDLLDATDGGFSYDMYHYTSLGISFFLNSSNSMNEDRSREIVRIKKRQARRKNRQSDTENYRESSNYYYEDIQKSEPAETTQTETENRTDISDFKKKYAENDLPVVSEYNIKGVFGRSSRDEVAGSREESALEKLEREAAGSRTLTFKSEDKEDISIIVPDKKSNETSAIIYGVQILATKSKADIPLIREKYDIAENIDAYSSNGLIRYVAGSFSTYESAAAYAKILQKRGIPDAFVVSYLDGKSLKQ